LLLAGISLLIASVTPRRGLGVAAIIAVLIVLAPVAGILQGIGEYSHNALLTGYAGLANPFALVDGVQTWLFDVDSNTGIKPPDTWGGPVYLIVALAVIAGSFALLNVRYRRVSVS
jgi:ABC-2 type transport system permease protein